MESNNPSFVKRISTVTGKEYANLLATLKERFRRSRIKAAVKVNTAMLEYYWELGRDVLRLRASAKWGNAFFECLSLDLKAEFPNQPGFSVTNLKYAMRWYDFYNQDNTNRQQAVDDLEMPLDFGLVPWGHHIFIFTHSNSIGEALFYIEKTVENSWSRGELEANMAEGIYNSSSKVITNFDALLPQPQSGLAKAILKSPYDFSFINRQITNERQLENALAENITRFLLELGSGFAYVGRQIELRMPGGQTFIPDMIFYHTRLKRYIVCELKVKPFIPDCAGKLNFYVSAVDELMKQDDDNPTIGLLICKSKDDTVVEWSFRGIERPLGVSEFRFKYELEQQIASALPSENEIQRIIDTYADDETCTSTPEF